MFEFEHHLSPSNILKKLRYQSQIRVTKKWNWETIIHSGNCSLGGLFFIVSVAYRHVARHIENHSLHNLLQLGSRGRNWGAEKNEVSNKLRSEKNHDKFY